MGFITKSFQDVLRRNVHGSFETINNIRYADDTAIHAENLEDLQTPVTLVKEAIWRKGLKIKITKTVGRINVEQQRIWVDAEEMERLNHLRNLASWLNTNVDSDEEITTWIEISR